MKKKGFTLVELLVVIAIIALLMGILMPALARVRQIAFRMVCGTNLSGIGKAMLIYANDYDDELPRAGGPGGKWALKLPGGFGAATPILAYGISPTTLTGGSGTITSSFYLLVKYAEVTTKSFICKGDSGVSAFEPANNVDVVTLWDFGDSPLSSCSYSYHTPYCSSAGGLGYPLTTSSEPGMAVAADPSPWLDPEAAGVRDFTKFTITGGKEFTKLGNTITHQDEGQNVLFLDAHVDFETVSFCGINDDNIYTQALAADWKKGTVPANGSYIPISRQDNLLSMDKGGADKGRACFTAETPVWVNGQMVEISKVVAGQKVDTIGSINGLEEHGAGINPCYELTLESGNSLLIVHSHYFMTVSGEWKRVDELSAGMQLKSMNGSIAVKSVVKKAMPFLGGSYNLNINGAESYYVGQDGVVALDCNQKVWETLEEARQ